MALQTVIPVERLVRRSERVDVLDAAALAASLRAAVRGEVRVDAGSRAAYSADASNYRRVPIAVVIPSSEEDVVATIDVCRAHRVPVVPRGGGTALAGQTVNEAVVLDFSKRLNRSLAVDMHGKTARVEPGVVADDLEAVTQPLGLTFGPQPATHSRCCFGGMLANNCGGMRAQRNGTAVENVEAMDILLYDGTRVALGWMKEDDLAAAIRRGGREGDVYARLRALRDRWADRIRAGYPKLPRRVSGYNLDRLLPDEHGRFNLARVIVGSEGTLAVMLDATVKLLDDPAHRAVVAIGYEDVFRAADAVPRFLDLAPTAFEGMDDVLKRHMEKKGGHHAKSLSLLPRGGGWLFLELAGKDQAEVRAKIDAALARSDGV
ncbi:MAG TPA: FAD-binding oxidoreductase, partial [Labilithrix sp.]